MKKLIIFFALPIFTFAFLSNSNAQKLTADLVVINARVRTMDAAKPSAEAVAVLGNRIAAVGSTREIRALAGANTKTIDAQGRLVLPGFNDSHVHFLDGGAQLSSVDLRDARTPQEFAERIRNFASRLPKGRWILGGMWDHENWTPNALPTREMIDRFTPDNPVFVMRLDGHMALANSLALKLAGVTKETKDVEGGLIVRDARGEPAGVLKDAAMNFVYRVIPADTFEQKLEAIQAATDYAAALGVTSVQDMSAGTDIAVYQELIRRGKLKTRVYAVSTLSDWQRWSKTGVGSAFGDAMLRVGGLKGFADGSLGSTTAWFYEPYLDDPKSTGLPSDEMPKMV
ncbi:MAG TPA: amidohydrolase, partial [Pyrinomonadaceae bacterium]|nr:amidohydrolase [Pyrinomonadaceae bacterium]